jgi:hypothetical protein
MVQPICRRSTAHLVEAPTGRERHAEATEALEEHPVPTLRACPGRLVKAPASQWHPQRKRDKRPTRFVHGRQARPHWRRECTEE